MFRLVPESAIRLVAGMIAYAIWYVCVAIHRLLCLVPNTRNTFASKHAGKTVLVTTGRQAKTLHTVRALKALGCRVVVTDYQEISCSAVSTACDAFYLLSPLDSKNVDRWVELFEEILVRERVDLVVPMSTINEALFIGVTKDVLQPRHPHVIFSCEGLDLMMRLDNRALFAKLCRETGVPVPEDGVVSSIDELEEKVPFGQMDVILKRIESTVNREAEIKIVPKEMGRAPPDVKPTASDPWQWQRFIKGVEYSAWFVCFEGNITFQGCYRSEADLLYFDGIPVPPSLEMAIGKFAKKLNLTGQYAFDYFQESSTGIFYVIECNPRGSSVLEGVSNSPGWAASFFGDDMRANTLYQDVGFLFHLTSWPFASRWEGFLSVSDPLPFFVAELAWPLEMLRVKGGLRGGELSRHPQGLPPGAGKPLTALFPTLCEAFGLNYHHMDVNIGKIIVPGPTLGRDYATFETIQRARSSQNKLQ